MVEGSRHYRNKARWGRKVNLRYHVVEASGAGPTLSAHTGNISVGGAYIVTEDPAPRGAVLRVMLTLPPDGKVVEVDAEVRWVFDAEEEAPNPELEGTGMGVRFKNLTPAQIQELNQWFASLTATVDHDDLA